MAEVITIISLSAILAAFVIYHIFTTNKFGKIMYDQQVDYMRMCDKHQEAVDDYNDLLKKYSESLDKHDRAYEELNNRYTIAQAQIEAKDLEIVGLQSKVDYLREHQGPCDDLGYCVFDSSDKDGDDYEEED